MIFNYNGQDQDILDKAELVVGETYKGESRNANQAVWLGDCFECLRYKFGCIFPQKIHHPEDDDGFDVFLPLRKLNERLPG